MLHEGTQTSQVYFAYPVLSRCLITTWWMNALNLPQVTFVTFILPPCHYSLPRVGLRDVWGRGEGDGTEVSPVNTSGALSIASRDHFHPSLCHQHRPGHGAGVLHCQLTIVFHILRHLVIPAVSPLASPFPSPALDLQSGILRVK